MEIVVGFGTISGGGFQKGTTLALGMHSCFLDKHPSGAKALVPLAVYGTTEVVPRHFVLH
jgi:hypothetical protein